jgi:hypothetical protein
MTTIKVFEYKYEVSCEDDTSAEYYCSTYNEAHKLFCSLIEQGYTPYLTTNDKFDATTDMLSRHVALSKILGK